MKKDYVPRRTTHALSTVEALVGRLAQHGVQRVFGIPGTHNLPLYRALAENTTVRYTATRHEQGAGYAADGYARASGGIAACFVTTGPGITNLATPIAAAYADSIPLIAVATAPPSDLDGTDSGFLHESRDQFGALSALTELSARVRSPDEALSAVDAAMTAIRIGRPRPIYLEIPVDALELAEELYLDHPPLEERPVPEAACIERAATLLSRSQRCALILGGGAVDAADVATRLAHQLDATVLTTVNGKGVVSEYDAHSLGAGLRLPAAHDFLRTCDVILAVGTELGESDLWVREPLDLPAAIIRVDIDPSQLNKNASAAIGLLGDAKIALELLLDKLGGQGSASRAPNDLDAIRRTLRTQAALDGGEFRGLMSVLNRTLPQDAIVVNDSSRICYFGAVDFLPRASSRQFLYTSGFATLGYGVPAAIGAKLACPDRPVVVLTGDGGLMFTIAELSAAAAARLPLPVIVHSDGGYGKIRDEMLEGGIPPLGVNFDVEDLTLAAQGFGAAGVRLNHPEQMAGILDMALKADHPTLIEIPDAVMRSVWS